MIRNLIFVILFLKIFFRPYNFFIFVHTFQWTSSEFFYSRFSSRESQRQQRLVKKITHFTIQFRSKNLTHFTNFNSVNIIKNILPQRSQNMYLIGVRKNIYTAPFLDAQGLHSQRVWKANVCVFLNCKSRFEHLCSRDVESFYPVRGWIFSFRHIANRKMF